MDLGMRVREARTARKLSQEALARRANLSLNIVNKLERGVVTDPHYSTVSSLADALGLTVEQLVEKQEPGEVLAGKVPAPPEPGPKAERRRDDLESWKAYLTLFAERKEDTEAEARRYIGDIYWSGREIGAVAIYYGRELMDVIDHVWGDLIPWLQKELSPHAAALEFQEIAALLTRAENAIDALCKIADEAIEAEKAEAEEAEAEDEGKVVSLFQQERAGFPQERAGRTERIERIRRLGA